MDILEEIVQTDDKQRYSFNEDKTSIRVWLTKKVPVKYLVKLGRKCKK